MLQVNDLEFEFIQFVGGDVNSHKDFYDQYEPGLQHICVIVDEYDRAIKRMESLGATTLIEGESDDVGRYIYLWQENGLTIELYDEKLSQFKVM